MERGAESTRLGQEEDPCPFAAPNSLASLGMTRVRPAAAFNRTGSPRPSQSTRGIGARNDRHTNALVYEVSAFM